MVSPTSIRSRILKVPAPSPTQPMTRSFTHVDPFEDTERRPSAKERRAAAPGFTHVDPFEDTESAAMLTHAYYGAGFTHVDPFEDTESGTCRFIHTPNFLSFTHVDPFEDTESPVIREDGVVMEAVSPTSIRSRILKGRHANGAHRRRSVSPTSIRSRILKGAAHDILELLRDVSPTSIRSRILKG